MISTFLAYDDDPESLTDSEPQLSDASYGCSQISSSGSQTSRASKRQVNPISSGAYAYGYSDCSVSVLAVGSEWADPSCAVRMESDAQCIVVVEKEGIFRRLVEDKFCDSARAIVVTGCGKFMASVNVDMSIRSMGFKIACSHTT
jgi:hypothetical protein